MGWGGVVGVVGERGCARFCVRGEGTTAEAERNKAGDGDAKRGSLLKTTRTGDGGKKKEEKKGREGEKTKAEARKKEKRKKKGDRVPLAAR